MGDLAKATTAELVAKLKHPNKWFRQTVLRILGDRGDRSAVAPLVRMMDEGSPQEALEAIWGLHASGGLDDAVLEKALDHDDPHVRLWAVRLMCDSGAVSPTALLQLLLLAETDPDVEVRVQLACSARRLSPARALPIIARLMARDEDAADPRMPLLVWWALEAKLTEDGAGVVALLEDKAVWSRAVVKEHLLERLMRRFAAAGRRADLEMCGRLLALAPDGESASRLLAGFEKAFEGRSIPHLPDSLAEMLEKRGGSIVMGVRRGRAEAVEKAVALVVDPKAKRPLRLQVIQALGESGREQAVPALLEVATAKDGELQQAALTALQSFDAPEIGATVVREFGAFPKPVRRAALGLVASRTSRTREFLEAVDAGTLDPKLLSANAVRRLRLHRDERVQAILAKYWGDGGGVSTEEARREIGRLLGVVGDGAGDPYKGKRIYAKSCLRCHSLFDEGGAIGPDLTSYDRDDVERMLVNVVTPSVEVREGFETWLARTKSGRVASGFLVERDAQVVVLRGVDGQNLVLRADEVEAMKVTGRSIMPDGLLKNLTDEQVRDLFAYLRSAQPLND